MLCREILSTENKFNEIIFQWKASECLELSQGFVCVFPRIFVSGKFDYFFCGYINENSKSREIYFSTLVELAKVDVASSFHWMIKHKIMQKEIKNRIRFLNLNIIKKKNKNVNSLRKRRFNPPTIATITASIE